MHSSENFYHVIKDPVHGTMQFTPEENNWIKPFIDHPMLQRLRSIKQLGLNDYIFPGAVHTRFNHSLGCCYIASQIANKLGLPPDEKQLVMIACLLHDVGHGPFSHSFEGIFSRHPIRHENWTPFFLNEFKEPDFISRYADRNPHAPISESLFHRIEQLIMHQHPPSILQDIVSSQLDADRLDYLLRDSHFCGVKYGEFDYRWMLHCLTPIDIHQGQRLGITHKGIGVVEHYLMARRLMTRNIYSLNKTVSISHYLVELLKHAVDYNRSSSLCSPDLWTFLSNTQRFNHTNYAQHDFLQDNYAIYKSLSDHDILKFIHALGMQHDDHPAVLLAQRLLTRMFAKMVPVQTTQISTVNTAIDSLLREQPHIQSWQVKLIETPHQYYNSQNDVIWVLDEHKHVHALHDSSPMIRALSQQTEQVNYLCIDQCVYPEIQSWLVQCTKTWAC